MPADSPLRLPLLLFDGHCALCTGLVQTLLKIDRKGVLYFAPLQSLTTGGLESQDPGLAAFAKTRFNRAGLSPDAMDTVVLLTDDGVYTKSDAVIRLVKYLGWPWRILVGLSVLPKGWRDLLYDFIAARRLAWFGSRETCWLPQAGWRHRFLGE